MSENNKCDKCPRFVDRFELRFKPAPRPRRYRLEIGSVHDKLGVLGSSNYEMYLERLYIDRQTMWEVRGPCREKLSEPIKGKQAAKDEACRLWRKKYE
tara:strand:+ start:7462 stop:7755 length:294 start_codon:yes stop_codon:yes gene_type:complete